MRQRGDPRRHRPPRREPDRVRGLGARGQRAARPLGPDEGGTLSIGLDRDGDLGAARRRRPRRAGGRNGARRRDCPRPRLRAHALPQPRRAHRPRRPRQPREHRSADLGHLREECDPDRRRGDGGVLRQARAHARDGRRSGSADTPRGSRGGDHDARRGEHRADRERERPARRGRAHRLRRLDAA